MAEIKHINNPELKTILKNWKGNPIGNERFIDPHKRFGGTFKKFLQWKSSKNEKLALISTTLALA